MVNCVVYRMGGYLSVGTRLWGRGEEAMGGEGESGGLKKKGRVIGPHWAISSSSVSVESNERNKSIRK
jgi:hypothetical protein